MAQLSDDCFAFGGAVLSLADAQARIAAAFEPVAGVTAVPLEDADRRILAHDYAAARDLPFQTNSAVDGYAVHHADLAGDRPTTLPLSVRISAGHPSAAALPRGLAARVFTGALLPDGADTVLMQEDCEVTAAGVVIAPGIARGANRRPAGEDIAAGAMALTAGRRLVPPDLALLAALGHGRVAVRAPLTVALFSTGDELADPPATLRAGQVYDANRAMLAAMLRRAGAVVRDGGILPDEAAGTAAALGEAARSADLVLTSGGVSAGEEDHVRTAIEAAGRLEFWRVGIKPGRAVALGEIAGTPLLGLPGNPVAALVSFVAIGRPLLDRLAGAVFAPPLRVAVPSAFAYRKKPGRREYVRVRIRDGMAHRYPKEGTGIITSLTESDALMELPEAMTALGVGEHAPCVPLHLLYG